MLIQKNSFHLKEVPPRDVTAIYLTYCDYFGSWKDQKEKQKLQLGTEKDQYKIAPKCRRLLKHEHYRVYAA